MSRLIVRGLPSYLTDARLREHFSQKGAVTDVKLMRRPDGTSRKFGFVGYRSEDEAQLALDYFNRTFIDTARITVEVAKKIGDEDLSKQREERHGKRKAQEEDGVQRENKKAEADKAAATKDKKKAKKDAISFEEFMAVMQPKSKRKGWQNEDAPSPQSLQDITAPVEAMEQKAAKAAKKEARAKAAYAEATEDASDLEREVSPEPDAVANDAGLTDAEYLQLRMKHKVGTDLEAADADAKEFEQSDNEADAKEAELSDSDDEEERDAEFEKRQAARQKKAQEAAQKDQETVDQIMESGRLFVRNLPFAASEDDIKISFEKFGTVSQVHIPIDKHTKAPKGLAFVTFSEPAHALAAYRAKDGSTFQGRLLHLLPAINRDAAPEPSKEQKKQTLKQARAAEKKQDAGKDFNWSMLYMSSDAVASSIADRLGVSKSDILNPAATDSGTDNAAVRLALAETRIIQETKEFFAQEGIDVDAFQSARATARSDTTILVKNIPYGTSVDEIQKLFEEHGEVDKVLIPPSGTIAIVEMPVPTEARVAFRAIAYKRFRTGILYLEKAPLGLFSPAAAEQKTIKQAPIVGKSIQSGAPEAAAVDDTPAEAVEGATLYLKNLSFSTTDERLIQTVRALSDFAFARVQTKPDPKRPGGRLSMGYGFVGFTSVASAKAAQRVLNGKVVDGHTLVVTFARRNVDAAPSSTAPRASTGSTKILIKNLPFEVTKKDIRELFSSQGQLKSVRLPKKFDNSTRGFGFVEYTTLREAQAAFEALKHTHLLGRHYVLQWSNESTDTAEQVDAQRSRTKGAFVPPNADTHAKRDKIKLTHEDITAAARKERRARQDVDDPDEDL